MSDKEYDGWLATRKWRWYALTVWIAAFTIVVIIALIQVRDHANEIQQSRRDSILHQCLDQNQRHKNTIEFLTHLAQQEKKDNPERTEHINTALSQYKLLIQALAPYQNCQQLVKNLTGATSISGS